MLRFPEPAFFFLVPMLAAALAWPLERTSGDSDRIPAWAPRVLFAMAASVFFVQSANRHWQFASGSRDLGSFVQQHWLLAHGYVPFNTVMGMHMLLPLMNMGYVGAAEPASLLLLLPNWGERFLSTHRTRWWGYYYGMPAVAMACLGLLAGWRRLQQSGTASGRLPVYVVACALIAGLFPPYRTPNGNQRSDLYFLQQPNASAPEDVQTQRALVRYVGLDPRVRVAAQFNLLPHLAERPFIVMLDHTEEADVIALQLNGGTYPEGRPAWKRRLWDMDASGGYHVAFCEGHSVALRTGPGPGVPCPSWEALMRSRPTADQVGR